MSRTWSATGWCGRSSRRTRRIRTGRRADSGRKAGGKRASSGRPPLSQLTVRRVVQRVLRGEHRGAAIAVTFLGPTRMKALNREWKGHDTPTDVISFALPGPHGELIGDVYICPAVAKSAAKQLEIPVREELIRLVIHGTLHVLGYDHPEGAGRTRSAMWRRQERYLKACR